MLPSPNDIEHCLLHSIPPPPGFDGEILRTVLLSDPAANEQEAFAVVSRRGGRCVTVGGFDVLLVSLETPMGSALAACRSGDDLPLGRVLAVDDSLTQSAEAKRGAQAAQAEHAAQCREAAAEEKRRSAAERQNAKQREQEAFERRAVAHFEHLNNKIGSKSSCKDAQLEWVFVTRRDLTDE